MRILIVEDELKTREGLEMLVGYLRPYAHVTAAECGERAIELCRDQFYDLIFTDIKMPGMNGFQMLSQLELKGRMIVIVSGYADFTYAREAIRFSALDYVLKPVSAVKIKDVLQLAYERQAVSRGGCFHSFLTGYEAMSKESRDYYWGKMDLHPVFSMFAIPPSGEDASENVMERVRKSLLLLEEKGPFSTASAVINGQLYGVISAGTGDELGEGIQYFTEFGGGNASGSFSGIMTDGEALVSAYRELDREARDREDKSVSQTVRVVRNFVRQNLEVNMSLAMLAEVAYVHPAYLSTLFKKETGENLTEYIVSCRIERAKELLSDSHARIYEVAVAVGYGDAKYFSSVFKNATGMTPREWRTLESIKI